jgi:hypothetical protein
VDLDQPVVVLHGAVDDDEDEVVVLVQLRALVEVLRILDGERMEAEGVAENLEVGVVRGVQVEPEELPRGQQLLDVLAVEVQLLRAAFVEDAAGLRRIGRALDRMATVGGCSGSSS